MHIQTSHWNWHGHCTLISNTPLNRSRFWHMIMKLTSTLHVDHKDSLKPVTFLRHTGIQISQWNWHRHCTLIINAPLDRSHFWHICAFKLGSEIDIEKCTLVTSTPLHRSLPSLVPVAGVDFSSLDSVLGLAPRIWTQMLWPHAHDEVWPVVVFVLLLGFQSSHRP